MYKRWIIGYVCVCRNPRNSCQGYLNENACPVGCAAFPRWNVVARVIKILWVSWINTQPLLWWILFFWVFSYVRRFSLWHPPPSPIFQSYKNELSVQVKPSRPSFLMCKMWMELIAMFVTGQYYRPPYRSNWTSKTRRKAIDNLLSAKPLQNTRWSVCCALVWVHF